MSKKISIGPYSAYAIAVKYGYTGTEEQWVQEQEANRLSALASAQKAEQAKADAEDSATRSNASAEAAAQSATTAEQRSIAAQVSKDKAISAAESASTSASNAQQSAQSADKSATASEAYANAAAQSAQQAADSLQALEEGIAAGDFKGEKGDQGPKGDTGAPGKDAAIDSTLSVEGEAADAKVTGEAIEQLKGDLGDVVDIDEGGFKPGQNCFDSNDPGIEKGYLSKSGTINSNDDYDTSTYIDVANCLCIAFYRKKTDDTIVDVAPFVCFFDAEKKYLAASYSNSKQIVSVPTVAKYMRFSISPTTSSPLDYFMAIVSNSETVQSPNALIRYSEPAKRSVKIKQDSKIRENTENIAQIQKNVGGIFYCGKSRDYKTLREVIEEAAKYPHSTVYLDAETFDLVQEFGEDYLNAFVSSNNEMCGLFLGNDIRIIGNSGTKVVFNYDGPNEQIHQYFSPFNAGRSSVFKNDATGYTLENLLVESTNCRYSVHDERGSDDTPYTNRYIGCTFIHDSSKCSWGAHQAIGGGLGVHGTILIESCYAVSTGYGQTISYHNCTSTTKTTKSEVIIKDSFLSGRAHCANYGVSTEKSRMMVCNCSLSQAPTLEKVITEDRADNMELIAWNNEIRTN